MFHTGSWYGEGTEKTRPKPLQKVEHCSTEFLSGQMEATTIKNINKDISLTKEKRDYQQAGNLFIEVISPLEHPLG